MSGSESEYILIEKFRQQIKIRGASLKRYKSYVKIIKNFLKSGKSIKEFILESKNKRETYLVLKFFTENILEKSEDITFLEDKFKVPVILTKNEINRMIHFTKNITHRAILCTFYFAGLRLNEVRLLKWSEIDFENDKIIIGGAKSRCIFLHPKLKEVLLSLFLNNRNNVYVFVSPESKIYDERTIQQIVARAARRARIYKRVTPFTLRHSFAVHLLEGGADIRYVQYLLGHKYIRSTQIYEYLAKIDLKSLAKLI
ncbi:MAG: tyrosine-type recombinase/integrase [Candidatus Aenigmatarchaeota archaeon]